MARGTTSPFDPFTPPGEVTVSPSALMLARQFRDDVIEAQPDQDWVVTFHWADTRRVRRPPGGQWEDIGAGLDLAAYERHQVPPRAVQIVEGVEFAVKVPAHIYKKRARRLIDRDDTVLSRLTLR